jgi:hypothetical protein
MVNIPWINNSVFQDFVVAKLQQRVHHDFGEICMNAAINICSGPKLLANPVNPVLFVVIDGNPLAQGSPSEHLPHCTIETIRERAETVTPLLREILDHWPPEHWGINE